LQKHIVKRLLKYWLLRRKMQ